MSTWDRRQVLTGAGVIALAGALAGCAEEEPPPPVPTGPEAEGPTPVTTTAQMDSFVGAIHKALTKADEDRDADELEPRITGPAARYRKEIYRNIGKDEDHKDFLVRPGTETLVPITTSEGDFPRYGIALVAAEDEDAPPYFMILRQHTAQDPYVTWAWAQQHAGVDMPEVPPAEVGAERVRYATKGLLMEPRKAMELYGKVLTDGGGADEKDRIAEDPFRSSIHDQLQTEREELNEGVERDEVGTVKEVYEPDKYHVAGLRTDDGGAIVLGVYKSSRKIEVQDGAKVSYEEDNLFTSLIGAKEFSTEYVREYGTMVALYIPPEDSDAQIQPIGATRCVRGARGE